MTEAEQQIITKIKKRVQDKDVDKKKKMAIDKITYLQVSGIEIENFTDKIKCFFEMFTKLEDLDLSECKLKKYDKFPCLPSLKVLDISQNELDDKVVSLLKKVPNLVKLILASNQITKLKTISKIGEILKNLQVLQCFENPIAEDEQGYRKHCFQHLPSLKFLDNFDKEGNENQIDEQDDEEFEIEENEEKNEETSEEGEEVEVDDEESGQRLGVDDDDQEYGSENDEEEFTGSEEDEVELDSEEEEIKKITQIRKIKR